MAYNSAIQIYYCFLIEGYYMDQKQIKSFLFRLLTLRITALTLPSVVIGLKVMLS